MSAAQALRRWGVAAFLGVALLLVGCGGGIDDDGRGRTTSTPDDTRTEAPSSAEDGRATAASSTPDGGASSTTSTMSTTSADELPTAAEQEVIDRYLGFWRARWAANTGTPNPAHPALSEFAAGDQLDAVIAEAGVNLERGLAYREAAEPTSFQQVDVVSIEGEHAVVQECVVDDGLVVRSDSGEVVDDDVTTHNMRGELTKVDGVWKVSRIRPLQVWEGVAGCASGA